MLTFKRIAFIAAAAAVMAGCSSGVKLNDASVEDRNANNATSGVAGVDLTGSDIGADGGPRNVGRVVYFDFDSYVVKPEAQGLVDANARFLKADASRKVVVEGHTDERGGREYNLALGQKRAEAVRRSLNLLGVQDSQVEAVSFGKEKPAAEGANEAAYAQNRRAELSYRR
ncbi:peptidoglycan-associated lipoprotein Pal [Comamonas nitrativorans]|uniref:Peptidoglycan-associated lipoprotein n=1 Tax=Comamonas nitrativorans TaxID=108437 RepID=A0ABV9GVS3_9BURK|nr:peptidoglycan-associated lipoprotein Pal [Comamonas sp.]